METEFKIFVENIDKLSIEGWYINETEPQNNRLMLFLDDRLQSEAFANIPRCDVEDVHDKLYCGFKFDISKFPPFEKVEIKSEQLQILYTHQYEEEINGTKNNDRKTAILKPYDVERNNRLSYLKINLNQQIDGENWYYAEERGRWAGPGLISKLNIPPLALGSYRIELIIENSFFDLTQLKIFLNDSPVKFKLEQSEVRNKLYGKIVVNKKLSYWDLMFHFPTTTMPDGPMGSDKRKLAIYLCSVVFYRI